MKIRTGFVSNSSSSSFIVARNPERVNADPMIELTVLMDYLSDRNDDCEIFSKNREEILKKIEEYKEFIDESEYKKLKKELLKTDDEFEFLEIIVNRNIPFDWERIIRDNGYKIIYRWSD